ncbi:MAG TPA: hypothetical protein VF835_05075 [Rhizomicrobium sp.]
MKMIRVTADDGSRVEVNVDAILYMRWPPPELREARPPRIEIAFANGDKLLVRQTLDQLLVLCGCPPPHLAAKSEPE